MTATARFATSVQKGEHALLEFHAADERVAAMRAYVKEGLAAGERTIIVAYPETPERIREMLADLDGFEDAIVKGRLLVFPGSSFHESLGTPTRASLHSLHEGLVHAAQKEGLAGVRAFVDVTYYIGAPERLATFEQAVGERFPFAFRLLCLVDGSKPEARAALARVDALHAHARTDRT